MRRNSPLCRLFHSINLCILPVSVNQNFFAFVVRSIVLLWKHNIYVLLLFIFSLNVLKMPQFLQYIV